MSIQLNDKRIQVLIKVLLFACATAIIVQLFPSQGAFRYQYSVGKPWAYELVTAPFNFPIFKDAKLYSSEQQTALVGFSPYYKIDTRVIADKTKDILNKANKDMNDIPPAYKQYIISQLNFIYSKGLIGSQDLNQLSENGDSVIFVVDSAQVAKRELVAGLFTVKTAYEYILKNKPVWANDKILKSSNLNYYLVENISFDEEITEIYRTDILDKVSQTAGMIQAGERIVDRGEIVTEQTSVLLNSLKLEIDKQKGANPEYNLMWLGELIIVFVMMFLLFLFLFLFRPIIFADMKNIVFILLLMVVMMLVTSLTVRFGWFNIYFIPFAILPIIIRTFYDTRTAVFTHIVAMLILSLIVPEPYEFLLIQTIAGMSAVSGLKDLTQRSHLAKAMVLVFLSYSVMYFGYGLVVEGNLMKIEWSYYIYFAASSLSLLLAYGLIFLIERVFGFLSSVSLVELLNVNSPLMQEFAETAPGSFQHSLQVANLATEAAKKVNANALLVRIGALYHDIGKMANPMCFTENQLSGVNPLNSLDFEAAAKKVINHVDDGVRIAQKNNIPDVIIGFITSHHGGSITRYFYNSFRNKFPDAPVDIEAFRYSGESPTSKEQAIMMMADSVEAVSRSLPEYTDESINDMVERIIDAQIADGLFKKARITFKDVETVKAVFKEKLKTIYHTRVSYPVLNKDLKK